MKKIYYEKKGRRYVPVAEYDSDWIDSFPKGSSLVMCYPGGSSRRFNIDPNYAAMIAAGRVAEDAICKALVEASSLRPSQAPLTVEQIAAWQALAKSFGKDTMSLTWPAAAEASEKAVKAMQEEAMKLMQNPAVKKAWDRFQMICELTKENQTNGTL